MQGFFYARNPSAKMLVARESELFADYLIIAEALLHWVDGENLRHERRQRLGWSMLALIINDQDQIFH